MNPMRMLILLTVVGTTGSILFAAEPAGTPKPDTPPAATPASSDKAPTAAPAAEAAAADEKEGEEIDPAPPAKAADGAPSPQRFVPSEQVRADFDVSFPIDI